MQTKNKIIKRLLKKNQKMQIFKLLKKNLQMNIKIIMINKS